MSIACYCFCYYFFEPCPFCCHINSDQSPTHTESPSSAPALHITCKMSTRIFLLLVLSILSFSFAHPSRLRRSAVSSAQILFIAPSSSTCAGAPQPNQCRTADQAAAAIGAALDHYGITSPAEMAALTSTMAFETGDFKYNVNYYPGNPGQGTRNMQSAAFNLLYAKSIPALAVPLQAVKGSPNGVRDLLTGNDPYDFGSAAWFLTTQCPEGIRATLQSGNVEGWRSYMSSCIGASPTDDRQAYWQRAARAFGVVK